MEDEAGVLPVSGYVLAGGRSSRMGADKAGLMFGERSLVEVAVEKLAGICAEVAIAGNREDLEHVAPIVTETRFFVGPGAGIEAGLRHAHNEWCLFVPVDVPLLPVALLRRWAADVLEAGKRGLRGSYLTANGRAQPSICMFHRECLDSVVRSLNRGERRVKFLLDGVDFDLGAGTLAVKDVAAYAAASGATAEDVRRWFSNLNTPEEFAEAERLWARQRGASGEGRGVRD
ncbi:MAG TPA: molybdenum cofactor guanylyltransferase [Acidobacteriaceae bacterium]